MRDHYDFTNAKRNPFAKQLKQQVTINLANTVVDYFKQQSEEVGIPYQTLINLYLSDCKKNNRKLNLEWK